ncbi:UDP-glycosyltransferase 85A3-like [Morus notabilis]|uniref:UDP-glycosyltransferase 85A3-like n=1 Tax=Morus notabilis TaxID=981085 RepID=UPI000CED62AC|nr:UDP-glycosyltransferase 85A3-like [Morus notabilis]
MSYIFHISGANKPHAVCLPYPAQGHITPMLKLAKLLHQRGFHITFVNTEYNQNVSSSQEASNPSRACPASASPQSPMLIAELNDGSSIINGLVAPPVSCIVSDGSMSFSLKAAEEIGVPSAYFWTTSACGFMGYLDVKNAFLNRELEEEVYMNPSLGFDKYFGSKVCKLKKSLYELKQSPRAYFERFTQPKENQGYVQAQSDHTMFIKHSDDGKIGIVVLQRKYILDLLKETGMNGCRSADTPMDPN